MEAGKKQTFLIGTGHPMATCQGAAFEYALNIAFEVAKRKLNHLADIWWISNEYELGDFGMGGAYVNEVVTLHLLKFLPNRYLKNMVSDG